MNRKKQILILCRIFKTWRLAKKLSQEQVSLATGIDVSNYELERCEPSLRKVMELCDFYGLSLPWLLEKVEDIERGQAKEEEFMKQAGSRRDLLQ